MRIREEIREAVQKAWKITDQREQAFKLYVISIELQLDLRDLLAPVAKYAERMNIEASGKLPPRDPKA
jgi:hypothetical protein